MCSYPLRKGFPRNCCMRETAVKNCLPFPVQVEGHEISDSLMEFFSESHEIMVVFPWKFEGSILGGPVLPRNLFGLGSIATCYSLCRSPLVFFRHGATGTPLGSESWRMWFLWGDENICGDEHSKQRHWISKNCSFTKHQKKLMKSRTNLSLGFFQIIISQLLYSGGLRTPLTSKLHRDDVWKSKEQPDRKWHLVASRAFFYPCGLPDNTVTS